MANQATNKVMQSERFQAALAYLKRGFSVIPVGDDKKPLIKWREFQDRRATEDELLKWWTTWPGANIGIVTGKISGITVIDCDDEAAIARVEEWLPDSFLCPIVGTPRGGRHYWLTYTKELNTVADNQTKIDIRNDGAYVIAPPSMTAKGVYKWNCLGE